MEISAALASNSLLSDLLLRVLFRIFQVKFHFKNGHFSYESTKYIVVYRSLCDL